MKSAIIAIWEYIGINQGIGQRNTAILVRFFLSLTAMVLLYSVLFHYIMEMEGQEHSLLSGLYWTMVTMSTLGFGDITFRSDLGRVFSVIVLITGTVQLMIIMPFTFIQFFYQPLLQAQMRAKAPRELPARIRNHVIITEYTSITASLIERLNRTRIPYVILCSDLNTALEYYNQNLKVAVGEYDNPETYRKMRLSQARMLVAAGNERINAAAVLTLRETDEKVPVLSFAETRPGENILRIAGSSHVIDPLRILGETLAQRVSGGRIQSNIIGRFSDLCIAEAGIAGTSLPGKTLKQAELRKKTGIQVIGFWERGNLIPADSESIIKESHVMLIAATESQIRSFEAAYDAPESDSNNVIIIGYGRAGIAVADLLEKKGISFVIVEKEPVTVSRFEDRLIRGTATDTGILHRAGIEKASSVIITTHDDPTNIFLTIHIRHIRPDLQIITRADLETNISSLYRAGADFVMSLASTGSAAVLSYIRRNTVHMISEGLEAYRMKVPHSLAGKTIRESAFRKITGASIAAFESGEKTVLNPDPDTVFKDGDTMILIGSKDAEDRIRKTF